MGSVSGLSAASNLAANWASVLPAPNTTQSSGPVSSSALADVANVPTFSQLQQLEGTKPVEFKQVVADTVAQLKAAAEQNPNPFASSYLWGLINRFQFALDTGGGSTSSQETASSS
jgi:hypothetical protein